MATKNAKTSAATALFGCDIKTAICSNAYQMYIAKIYLYVFQTFLTVFPNDCILFCTVCSLSDCLQVHIIK